MITLLLVDDDTLFTEYLMSTFDWGMLGVDRILNAYNMETAQRILVTETVDLMLCDVEMPNGSGLELLHWAREKGLKVLTIILTAHAIFAYAQQALTLGSFGYLTKPVARFDLEHIVRKAVQLLNEQSDGNAEGAPLRIHDFWREVLKQRGVYNRNIVEDLENRYAQLHADGQYLLVLLAPDAESLGQYDRKTLHAISAIGAQSMPDTICTPFVVDGYVVSLSSAKEDSASNMQSLSSGCRLWLDGIKASCGYSFSAFIGEPSEVNRLYRQYDMLTYLSGQNVTPNCIRVLETANTWSPIYERPDFVQWEALLMEGGYIPLAALIDSYMQRLEDADALNAYALECFDQDFRQMLYSFMRTKKISANELFASAETVQQSRNATTSLLLYKPWINSILEALEEVADTTPMPTYDEMVIERAKQFINDHIQQDVSRREVAQHVALSPEHLSRLFHRQEGITMQKYIQGCKLEAACDMLAHTALPVGEIAQRLGFDNFSYFSQFFKKAFGVLPKQYRRNAHDARRNKTNHENNN